MLKELVKIADRLDSLGLTKEADLIDSLIKKSSDSFDTLPKDIYEWTTDDWDKYDQTLIDNGEKFETPEYARERDHTIGGTIYNKEFWLLSEEERMALVKKMKIILGQMTPERLAEIYTKHPKAMKNLFGEL